MTKTAGAEMCLEQVDSPALSIKIFWSSLSQNVAKQRCRLIHKSISHPVNGKYRCWTCLREFETDW